MAHPDYRKAAERAAKKYGIDPKIFLAMINQESGFNPNARSGAGAQGIAQFMPGTAKAYGVNLNDGRVTDDLEGAAKYIAANLRQTGGNYHQALSIYNSGKPNAYKDPGFASGQTFNYVKNILAAAGNGAVQGRGQKGSAGATNSSTTTTTRTIPGVDNSQQRLALTAAYLSNTHNPDALTALAAGLLGAKDTAAQTVSSSKTTKTGGRKLGRSSSGTAAVKLDPGANRPGVGLTPGIEHVAGLLAARINHPVEVGTGTNHNQMTTSGNVSDHWSGNGIDVPAEGDRLTRLGYNALRALGVSEAQARKMAETGGLFNIPYGKHRRVQVIFKTNEGGNHYNHLHIGVSPNK